MSFTLFVKLPNQDVCSLRRLAPRCPVTAVRKMLELSAGLPSNLYDLRCPEGQLMPDDLLLEVEKNVWDGYVLRAVFKENSWSSRYDAIVRNDVERVLESCFGGGGGGRRGDVKALNKEEEGEREEEEKEEEEEGEDWKRKRRGEGGAALFIASFLGLGEMCKTLLLAGADPDSKTPFGRTPLFAAMSADQAHVVELLLSRHASLQSRDADGTSALDVGQARLAKECLRKVRHAHRLSRASSAASSSLSSSGVSSGMSARGSSARSGGGGAGKAARHRPVVRIPTATSPQAAAAAAEGSPSSSSPNPTPRPHLPPNTHKPPPAAQTTTTTTTKSFRNDSVSPSARSLQPSPGPQGPGRTQRGGDHAANTTTTTTSRPSPRSLFQPTELYTWDNNLRSPSRTSSAAGTQVRIPVPGSGGERGLSGRASSPGNDASTTTTTTTSVSGGKRLSLRPSVQDLSVSGPTAVLKVSCPATPFVLHCADRAAPSGTQNDRSLLFINQDTNHDPASNTPTSNVDSNNQANDAHAHAHAPAQEPPGRPPSRQESSQEGDVTLAGSIYIPVPSGKPGEWAESGTAVREPRTTKGVGDSLHQQRTEPEEARQQGSGRCDQGSGSSTRPGPNLARSRRKQQATWRTMKRRLRLAEEQRRNALPKSPAKPPADKDAARASFQQWLRRKRRERERQEDCSEAETSSGGENEEERAANERAFNDWLRDLKERRLRDPNPFTAASLHRRKSRPLKNLIQVGGTNDDGLPAPDPDSYLTAYQEWRRGRAASDPEDPLGSPRDLKEARRRVEEKRKSLLAEALTYEDWLEHSRQRHKLMQAVLRADTTKMAAMEQTILHQRAPRQISYHEWRERLEKRETELRQQHMRGGGGKQNEPYFTDRNGYLITTSSDNNVRSSAAIPHEEWMRRKNEELQASKNRRKTTEDASGGKSNGRSFVSLKKPESSGSKRQKENPGVGVDVKGDHRSAAVSEEGKEPSSAWEMWLQRKHEKEMEELSRTMYEGKCC
ncbi:uncharacterized protein LOC143286086 isoform X2 [Babylonia areolata]|uniref:uncharacterized protein LOC143286086 isoform X2 n=1 Tax=Babylonia areolata TaxID=304850 RepID=UPI003FD0AA21